MPFLQEGRDAYRAGVKVRKCPYPDERRRAAWQRGWYEAERDDNPDEPPV